MAGSSVIVMGVCASGKSTIGERFCSLSMPVTWLPSTSWMPCMSNFLLDRQLVHVVLLKRRQFLGIETRRGLINAFQREILNHRLAREEFRLAIQGPAQQY